MEKLFVLDLCRGLGTSPLSGEEDGELMSIFGQIMLGPRLCDLAKAVGGVGRVAPLLLDQRRFVSKIERSLPVATLFGRPRRLFEGRNRILPLSLPIQITGGTFENLATPAACTAANTNQQQLGPSRPVRPVLLFDLTGHRKCSAFPIRGRGT
jgi:hypothetical protein